jgi:hypothetical protein
MPTSYSNYSASWRRFTPRWLGPNIVSEGGEMVENLQNFRIVGELRPKGGGALYYAPPTSLVCNLIDLPLRSALEHGAVAIFHPISQFGRQTAIFVSHVGNSPPEPMASRVACQVVSASRSPFTCTPVIPASRSPSTCTPAIDLEVVQDRQDRKYSCKQK